MNEKPEFITDIEQLRQFLLDSDNVSKADYFKSKRRNS